MLTGGYDRLLRSVLAALVLSLFMVGALAGGVPALAGRNAVRANPVITFSDGTVVQLIATIEADPASISSVNYALHVPAGMHAVSIEYWDGNRVPESVTVLGDMPSSSFSGTAKVGMAPGAAGAAWSVVVKVNDRVGATFTGKTAKPLSYNYKPAAK